MKYKINFAFAAACLILAFLITIQVKSVKQNNVEPSAENIRAEEFMKQLKSEKEKNEDLALQLENLKGDIESYSMDAQENSVNSKFLSDQLMRAELLAGLTDVEGNGIVLVMDDSKNMDMNTGALIHDQDLRDIVNELKAGGAEAISVNEQRITASSSIRCAGPTILVNDIKTAPPYTIKAIGNSETLEAAMNLKGGVADVLKALGFPISITRSENVQIGKYEGIINFSYAKAVKQSKGDKQ